VALGSSNGVRAYSGRRLRSPWFQEQPNELIHARLSGRTEIIKRGADNLSEGAKARTRTPPGHPEGYLEAFANLYAGFAEAIHAKREKREPSAIGSDIPTASTA
jgi:hypothetical protein